MRLAVDVLGAPPSGGGMRAYAEHLLDAWAAEFPGDELLLVGYDYLARFADDGHEVVTRPDRASSRVRGEWVDAGVSAQRWRADALLSTSTVVSPLFRRGPRVCTLHDWRHRLRPEEFSLPSRVYRRSWDWSATHADLVVQISDKTAQESARFVPGASLAVVPNGRDHAAAWGIDPDAARVARNPHRVVAFGHAVNKRPELVLAAVAQLSPDWSLTVLGARGAVADRLRSLADELGVADRLTLPGFVEEADYRRIVSEAGVVVLASTDEGFGLGVCEAEWFGIPCVVTDDSGLGAIHGEAVTVAQPIAKSVAAAITAAAERPARQPATTVWGWRDTARGVRAAVEERC